MYVGLRILFVCCSSGGTLVGPVIPASLTVIPKPKMAPSVRDFFILSPNRLLVERGSPRLLALPNHPILNMIQTRTGLIIWTVKMVLMLSVDEHESDVGAKASPEKSSRACSHVSGKLSKTKPWFLQGLDSSLSFTTFTLSCLSKIPGGPQMDNADIHTEVSLHFVVAA